MFNYDNNHNNDSTSPIGTTFISADYNHSLPLKKRHTWDHHHARHHPYINLNLSLHNQSHQHFINHHEQIEPLDLSNGHKCHECARSFKVMERLKAHQRRHEIKKSGRYTCELCNKPFVQQSSLITHKRIHTGEKPYHCKTCDNSYGDLSTYTKHTRTHTGEKPYQCEYCDQRFSQSGNCLRHKRSVHAHIFTLPDPA